LLPVERRKCDTRHLELLPPSRRPDRETQSANRKQEIGRVKVQTNSDWPESEKNKLKSKKKTPESGMW
jgi:hypothetical protein